MIKIMLMKFEVWFIDYLNKVCGLYKSSRWTLHFLWNYFKKKNCSNVSSVLDMIKKISHVINVILNTKYI